MCSLFGLSWICTIYTLTWTLTSLQLIISTIPTTSSKTRPNFLQLSAEKVTWYKKEKSKQNVTYFCASNFFGRKKPSQTNKKNLSLCEAGAVLHPYLQWWSWSFLLSAECCCCTWRHRPPVWALSHWSQGPEHLHGSPINYIEKPTEIEKLEAGKKQTLIYP